MTSMPSRQSAMKEKRGHTPKCQYMNQRPQAAGPQHDAQRILWVPLQELLRTEGFVFG